MAQQRSFHGMQRSRRHPGRNWQLDCDYAHKLSPSEMAWLSRFLEESYHSAKWDERAALHSREKLRELWRAYKANERDALTRTMAFDTAPAPEEDAFEVRASGAEHAHATEDELHDALEVRRALERKRRATG